MKADNEYIIMKYPLGYLGILANNQVIKNISLSTDKDKLMHEILQQYPDLTIITQKQHYLYLYAQSLIDSIFKGSVSPTLPIELNGTHFEKLVWTAIQTVPRGEVRSYSQIAEMIGKPKAIRAVASACAKNNLALLIPCHRIIGKNGSFSGYRWDIDIKAKILEQEKLTT